MAGCITIPLGTQVGLGPDDIVLHRDSDPPTLKGHSRQFSTNVRCGQMAGWTKMPLGVEVGLGPGGDFVFSGDPAMLEKRHSPIQFLAHVYCDRTAGWIMMPLGTEVNMGTGDVVLSTCTQTLY